MLLSLSKAQLERYFQLIDYTKEPFPTIETLEALYQKHITKIPYGNYGLFEPGAPTEYPQTEEAWSQAFDEIFDQKRQVRSAEGNNLLQAALRTMGFELTIVHSAIAGIPSGASTQTVLRQHAVVRIKGERYFIASHFNTATILNPIILPKENGEQMIEQYSQCFKIAKENDIFSISLQKLNAEGILDFQPLFSFSIPDGPGEVLMTQQEPTASSIFIVSIPKIDRGVTNRWQQIWIGPKVYGSVEKQSIFMEQNGQSNPLRTESIDSREDLNRIAQREFGLNFEGKVLHCPLFPWSAAEAATASVSPVLPGFERKLQLNKNPEVGAVPAERKTPSDKKSTHFSLS